MNIQEAMEQRHSVRHFTNQPLDENACHILQKEIDRVNQEGHLHFQLITNEPEAYQANKPSYGSFAGCRNYLALVAPAHKEEEIGYYGEQLVLTAQTLGINSCWTALTYKKGKAHFEAEPQEKLYMVIALGYGENQGYPHKSKSVADVSDYKDGDPDWYLKGIQAALNAPTAVNQQKFRFTRNNDHVRAKAGLGFYTKTDLGIVKYHFEAGSGRDHSIWE